jgi:nicotinamidase-related amidase
MNGLRSLFGYAAFASLMLVSGRTPVAPKFVVTEAEAEETPLSADSLAKLAVFKTLRPAKYFNAETLPMLDTARAPLPDIAKMAFLVIDAQEAFCKKIPGEIVTEETQTCAGNDDTELACRRLQAIVPDFRKTGMSVYSIYLGDKKDFYIYKPAPSDVLVRKDASSAFRSSNIGSLLRDAGKETLVMGGVNLSACVMMTALDARAKNYEVYVLLDLTANSDINAQGELYFTQMMRNHGVKFMHSQDFMKRLQAASPVSVPRTGAYNP